MISLRYKSSKPQIASVSKTGKVTAKKKGTAKIRITVTGKNNKKKSTWVNIKVTERKTSTTPEPAPQPDPTPTPDPAPVPDPEPTPEPESGKTLVAYFSATNTTQRVADRLADGLSADLYEIVPAVPYTAADLNYNNSSSRTSLEMNDPSARPAISGSAGDMSQYDTIFLGYPIWWGEAPRIISTFLESYDFSGKTIIPFCTSGGSGIGASVTSLRSLAPDAQWLSGQRFSGSASQTEIMAWVNNLTAE